MVGDELIVYFNGENLGLIIDFSYSVKGLIGLFINNCLFELDDLKVGDLIERFV